MRYTKYQISLACLICDLSREKVKQILELLPDGETPSLPGQVDRLFYSVPEEKILGVEFAKEAGVVTTTLIENWAHSLAHRATAGKDKLISDRIADVLGERLQPEALSGRVHSTLFPSGVEIVALDGRDILELYPIRVDQSTDGGVFKAVAVQKYRVLNQADNLTETEAALEKAGRQITGVGPDGC